MKISSASFLTSVANKKDILDDEVKEFAFVGRSNVGKSSLINSLVNQKKLVKTSSTPGRTRLINYFNINDAFRFVDLPGYGYALAGKSHKELWATLMEDYLMGSKSLKRVFLLVDIRLAPNQLDKQMLAYLSYTGKPFTIIATKSDKVPKSKIFSYVKTIANTFGIGTDNITTYSVENTSNKEKILEIIEKDLSTENN